MQDMQNHDSALFHAFTLQVDAGQNKNDTVANWDLNGWLGGDINKLWLKAEGEQIDGNTKTSEIWAMYSRNIATFWDAQVGVRHDSQAESLNYLTVGINGLAPYFFETEAYLFISEKGDLSLRLREENDFLFTQKLIVKPYIEFNFFAQDIPKQQVGSGLSNAEMGMQWRYEITRKCAPYIDVRYTRLFGETRTLASAIGASTSDVITTIGLQVMF